MKGLYIISIHVPREGDDGVSLMVWLFALYFYPRPPRGGRPAKAVPIAPATEFLSTSPARGTTHSVMLCQPLFANFYPRPPRGGRLSRVDFIVCQKTFLSTSPARGTTLALYFGGRAGEFLSTSPARGDDRCSWGCIRSGCQFLSTSPARGTTGRAVLR